MIRTLACATNPDARTLVPRDRTARPLSNFKLQTSNFLLITLVSLLFLGCGGPSQDIENSTGPTRTYDRGPLQLSETTSANPITTADTLLLTLEATLDDGYSVLFPAFPEAEAKADIDTDDADINLTAEESFTLLDYKDAVPTLLDDGRVRRKRTYFLEPFLDGRYAIPPLEIRFGAADESEDTWLRLETEPLHITVASVLAPDAEPELQGIVGPVTVLNPTPWGWYIFWAIILIAILGAAYYYRFVRVTPGPPPPPPIPPHTRALEALEAIEREKLVEKGFYKEHYIRVSDVLRRYMEEQFGFHASERTTEEFLQELQHSALLGLQEQLLLKGFLRHCDLVKFAKTEPTSEQIRDTFDTCRQFVKDTAAAQKQALSEVLEGA
ncbi:MAG: hypothetical protein L3K26_12520 [Candidatus Hydrogenedentes bacterium]|nr:hypothetical protein [Candidatus Hydrogenedentota bacterium]